MVEPGSPTAGVDMRRDYALNSRCLFPRTCDTKKSYLEIRGNWSDRRTIIGVPRLCVASCGES
jgi:hypothetical protein